MDEDADNYDDLTEIMSNAHLNTNFLALGRELDILEPKTPEDVFKSHLENQRPFGGATGHVSRNEGLVWFCGSDCQMALAWTKDGFLMRMALHSFPLRSTHNSPVYNTMIIQCIFLNSLHLNLG